MLEGLVHAATATALRAFELVRSMLDPASASRAPCDYRPDRCREHLTVRERVWPACRAKAAQLSTSRDGTPYAACVPYANVCRAVPRQATDDCIP